MDRAPESPVKFSKNPVSVGGSPRKAPRHEHHDEEDMDPKLRWLGQDLLQGRPNDWVHGYDPAFSRAYRLHQEERKKPVKIDGYNGLNSSASKFDNLPFH